MKSLFHIAILFVLGLTVTSCGDEKDPNHQYFPDMYEPVPYEAYGAYDVFVDEQEAKLPVEGTIPRGWKPYNYENSNEGYQNAKENLNNPLPYTEENLAEGRQLYTIYCAVCHGDQGDGQGVMVQREKILGIPAFDDEGRAITEGSVYHVMFYGLNAMGSYASQTNEFERWQIDHYVMSLKDELEGAEPREFEEDEFPPMETLVPAEARSQTATQDDDNGEGPEAAEENLN